MSVSKIKMNKKNRNYYNILHLIFIIVNLQIISINAQQYIWEYAYPPESSGCGDPPTRVSSFVVGQCYTYESGSIIYTTSGASITMTHYIGQGCSGSPITTDLTGPCYLIFLKKYTIQTTPVVPSEGYLYFERWASSSSPCSNINPIKTVLKPGVCSFQDASSLFFVGSAISPSSLSLGYSGEHTCPSLSKVTYTSSPCTNNADRIMNAFSVPSLSITFSSISYIGYNSISFTVDVNFPSSTLKIQYLSGSTYASTTCNSISNGQTCTINNIPTGITTNIKATQNEIPPFGGPSSVTSGTFTMPTPDSMKSLDVISKTTKTITVSYSSVQGVNGITTFVVKADGKIVSGCSFSQCSITGLLPGQAVTIVVNAVNYGTDSNIMSLSLSTYPAVNTPTLSITNTPTSITATYQSLDGIPGATTNQILLNNVIQTQCTSSPCTISGLTTLSTYNVQLNSINDGDSVQSAIQTVKLWDFLGVPTLSTSMKTKSAILSFSVTGGDPTLTRYSISVNGDNYAACQSISLQTCTVTGLIPSTSYIFEVAASNAGTIQSKSFSASTYSEISAGSVSQQLVTTKLISVNYGVSGGVVDETNYTVTYNDINAPGCIDIPTTNCTINNLQQTTSYIIKVVAINNGKSVTMSNTFNTFTNIDIPTLSVIGTPTSIFARYSTNNGVPSPSTLYKVMLNGIENSACTGTSKECLIEGLVTSNTYTVQVSAINDGTTTQSAIKSVKLWDIMSEPIIISKSLTREINIKYSAPGGNPLDTSFVVTMNGVVLTSQDCTDTQATASGECVVNNLTPNTTYKFEVKATNGASVLISTLDVKTYPLISNLKVQLDSITTKELSISYSSENGVPDVTTYTVSLNGAPVTGCTTVTTLQCIMKGLTSGSIQTIDVSVDNDQTTLSLQSKYDTIKEVTQPIITTSQSSIESIEIKYQTEFGVQGSTYDVIVNGSILCANTTELTCIFNGVFLGSLYSIKVIVYNDGATKNDEISHKTYESPTSVELETIPSESSILAKWNSSRNGIPGSTLYNTSISYNSKTWIDICSMITKLECNITNLGSATNYSVRVIVINSFYEPVKTTSTLTTLQFINNGNDCKRSESSPICSGNGECKNEKCECQKGWSGIFCHIDNNNNNNGNNTITPNPDNPGIIIDNNGISYRFELFSIKEIDDTSNTIKTLLLSKVEWKLESTNNNSIIHPITKEKIQFFNWTYSANPTSIEFSSISISFIQYKQLNNMILTTTTFPIEFAGKEFDIQLGSHKYTMRIDNWPFSSNLNSLVLTTRVSNPIGQKDGCGNILSSENGELLTSSSSGVTTFNIGDGNGNYIVGNLLNTIILDTIPMIAQFEYVQVKGSVEINTIIPYFSEFVVVDPDFSLILSTKSDSGCNNSDNKWKVIVGAVIGSVVGVALILGLAVYLKKRHTANFYNRKIANSLKKENSLL
ncbi:hypothetical protein PPL_07502 [Heterostelium album PN500]|uniref:Fibronectin type-III domain-containing protein n=1 Tax=Heterostelium pallidum (strain ATCC 26659 / Pp 5 / PN500) TaxID=670386 RepID=D3BG51_HETP5|nr:hypothetical protein PPL_07502 [Heterostelium album PN500]EFA79643.1 hypothetical protein PPL_07502 [Heterostelium album PN500]|eukprot:XP_020431764.1 hypothetical protein PPL_07502 [Heterostelium album PN500]